MTAILTKSELAEILLIDGQNYSNVDHALEYMGFYYQKVIGKMICRPDAFFIRSFRNRGYDIKLLIASENSKFLIS